ncbi:MAG: hypothetical protein L6V93_15625 [Clostridiales bacterium]|nr:MAG: hypothetical protein L6V93_15625 [Clostridiales bacterium]
MKFESAYYASGDKNIPLHIHKIFRDGMPADFRLVGATTRNPEEIPPALRSRCVEIYFNALDKNSVEKIAENAAKNAGVSLEDGVCELISQFADNGRDAVSIIQTSISAAATEGRKNVTVKDTEWVLQVGKYQPKVICKVRVQTISRRCKRSFGGKLSTGYFYENRGIGEEKRKRRKRFGERNYRANSLKMRGRRLIKRAPRKSRWKTR